MLCLPAIPTLIYICTVVIRNIDRSRLAGIAQLNQLYMKLDTTASDDCDGCVEAFLADPRVDLTADDNCVIRLAAKKGHVKCVELLLADERVNPADNDNLAIGLAAQNGHLECVELLLADKRVNPAGGYNHAICMAACFGHEGCVKLLLSDKRVDPNAVQLPKCHPSVHSLIRSVQECEGANLDAFKQMNLNILPNDVLDTLISRNRPFRKVYRHLLKFQLIRLGIPESAENDSFYNAAVDWARSMGVWRTSDLRKLLDILPSLHHDTTP